MRCVDWETKRPRFVLVEEAFHRRKGVNAWETKRPRFVLVDIEWNTSSMRKAPSRTCFLNEDETGSFRLPGILAMSTRTKQDCFVSQARPPWFLYTKKSARPAFVSQSGILVMCII